MKTYAIKIPRAAFRVRFLSVLLCGLLWLPACTAGIPKIPPLPDQIIEQGDAYYQRKKYFQAQELYKAFLQKYAGDDRSDYAQFRLAESYFADGEYPLAAVEYRVLVSNYGYSDYVDDAFFKEALCLYEQSQRAQLDQTKTYDALAKLRQFEQVFNKSPLVPEAQKYIDKIKQKLAHKEFENAMFYYDRKRYRSAGIYFDKVIENYDGNDYWARALYFKARILMKNGEQQEAARLLSQVMAYPQDVDVKADAQKALHSLNEK
jgi:outer membrane assembly lipoprotein YfiO